MNAPECFKALAIRIAFLLHRYFLAMLRLDVRWCSSSWRHTSSISGIRSKIKMNDRMIGQPVKLHGTSFQRQRIWVIWVVIRYCWCQTQPFLPPFEFCALKILTQRCLGMFNKHQVSLSFPRTSNFSSNLILCK